MTKASTKSLPTVSTVAKPATEKEHPLRAIRRAGVPLAAFETSDPAQTIENCKRALNGKYNDIPVMRWDLVRGLLGLNDKGAKAAAAIGEPIETTNPAEVLSKLADASLKAEDATQNKVLVFFLGAHRLITNEGVAQALWNLRDAFKARGSTLVMLAPSIRLPEELTHDIVVVTEPLPDTAEIEGIVDSIAKAADLKDVPDRAKVVDTMRGVSAFAAEQALAMSISKDGISRDMLWERKRKMVEQTPGLTVWRGGESFSDIGGLDNIKSFLTSILASGKNPVNCIGFIDEIEKMFAGAAGDTSGVSQDQLGVFLKVMQDENIPGIILIGPPGTGKSAIAKGAGSVAGAEVLSIDTGAMTGSLVGESQAKIRKAMQTFSAVSQGKGLFIATCNKIASLPPELRRRFTLGTFFVDLPTAEERNTIWSLWLKRYGIDAKAVRPADEGWTGAEIKACCDVADRTGFTLVQAANYIVPVHTAAAAQIDALRKMASNCFISASKSGVYVYNPSASETVSADKQRAAATPGGRKINLESN